LELEESVVIKKFSDGGGLFPPGTVKYCLSYYNKNGQESNIIYDSPLYYPIKKDRGCSPEELSGDSFEITVSNLDYKFDYIRLYSIIKTSKEASPIVKVVEDKYIKGKTSVVFTDTNTTGSILNPTILQYLGGVPIIAKTLDQKNNTLFLGNLTLKQKSLKDVLTLEHKGSFTIDPTVKSIRTSDDVASEEGTINKVYSYTNQLREHSSRDIKIFKYGERYRFGLQCQDINGVWSDVIHIVDLDNDQLPTNENTWGENFKTSEVVPGIFKYVLTTNEVSKLIDNNYKKARIVCCYPKDYNRKIITQGVVNPTIYHENSKDKDEYYGMASWFYRPISPMPDSQGSFLSRIAWNYNIDNLLYNYDNGEILCYPNIEIQSSVNTPFDPNKSNDTLTADGNANYAIDRQLVTINSAEILLDESLQTLPLENASIKYIGNVPINSFQASMYVDADIPQYAAALSGRGQGFIPKYHNATIHISNLDTHHTSPGYWDDTDVYCDLNGGYASTQYPFYPFQRKGPLNNFTKSVTMDVTDWGKDKENRTIIEDYEVKPTATLHSKVIANLEFSRLPVYYTGATLPHEDLKFFNSKESSAITINNKVYLGNVNILAKVQNYEDREENFALLSKEITSYRETDDVLFTSKGNYYINRYTNLGDEEMTPSTISSDPIPITYNSSPHIVCMLQKPLDGSIDQNKSFLQLVEIHRDIENSFDINPYSSNDVYVPCGDAVRLIENNPATLYGVEGDHYFMRYDDLKTYPRSTEDVNQIVEILSFMCETRINLDGRYDNNRGLVDNTIVNPNNFGLINMSYTQDNNFFSYTTLQDDDAKLNSFPNQITWTKTKTAGEDIDAWTNITLASIGEADGNKGAINKILNWNDRLLLFQDYGIAQIGYNEKTAISTAEGVPLELANSGKFTGVAYISDKIGCQNRWSICSSNIGILFIDDFRKELNLLNSEGINSLSALHGFTTFIFNNSNGKEWNPNSFSNFKASYDKNTKDIYYINKDYCLSYNEISNTFTSFYNYENVPIIACLKNSTLAWKDKNIYYLREGKVSTFFDEYKPYSITLCCDGCTEQDNKSLLDKIFNTIEYRGDIYNKATVQNTYKNNKLYNDWIFSHIAAENEYQTYFEFDINKLTDKEYPWKATRLYNIWRTPIPRASYVNAINPKIIEHSRDRIRNPYCYITLTNNGIIDNVEYLPKERAVLHDFVVYYTTK
jgi:hypothetical protein